MGICTLFILRACSSRDWRGQERILLNLDRAVVAVPMLVLSAHLLEWFLRLYPAKDAQVCSRAAMGRVSSTHECRELRVLLHTHLWLLGLLWWVHEGLFLLREEATLLGNLIIPLLHLHQISLLHGCSCCRRLLPHGIGVFIYVGNSLTCLAINLACRGKAPSGLRHRLHSAEGQLATMVIGHSPGTSCFLGRADAHTLLRKASLCCRRLL